MRAEQNLCARTEPQMLCSLNLALCPKTIVRHNTKQKAIQLVHRASVPLHTPRTAHHLTISTSSKHPGTPNIAMSGYITDLAFQFHTLPQLHAIRTCMHRGRVSGATLFAQSITQALADHPSPRRRPQPAQLRYMLRTSLSCACLSLECIISGATRTNGMSSGWDDTNGGGWAGSGSKQVSTEAGREEGELGMYSP